MFHVSDLMLSEWLAHGCNLSILIALRAAYHESEAQGDRLLFRIQKITPVYDAIARHYREEGHDGRVMDAKAIEEQRKLNAKKGRKRK